MNTATNYAEQQATRNAAKAIAAAQVKAQFPKLQQVGDLDSLRTATKNIRTELKAAFPSVKFTIKSSRFSMGDSITVSWTDGPNGDQVSAITGKYSAGSFNGMEDIYEYSNNAFNDVFGDAKYLHTQRAASDRAIESAIRSVQTKFGPVAGLTVEAYRKGNCYGLTTASGFEIDRELTVTISRRTWTLTK